MNLVENFPNIGSAFWILVYNRTNFAAYHDLLQFWEDASRYHSACISTTLLINFFSESGAICVSHFKIRLSID